ncbi:hypothetical protein AOLI_G00090010 [Acnodon oligacanthus]
MHIHTERTRETGKILTRPQRSTKERNVDQDGAASQPIASSDLLTEIREVRSDLNTISNLLDAIDGRLDTITTSLSSVQTSLAGLSERVASTETRLTEAQARISTTEDASRAQEWQLCTMKSHITQLQAKLDDLENRGQHKNLRIVGLPEKAERTTTLSKVLSLKLSEWLNLSSEVQIEIEQAHRFLNPAPLEGASPRSVLVRFLH